MKKYLILAALLVPAFFYCAYPQMQNINNPQVIKSFIEKSPIMYKMDELDDSIPAPDRSAKLNAPDFVRTKSGEEYFVMEYESVITDDPLYRESLALIASGKYADARAALKQLFEKYNDFYRALTLQGKCFIMEGKNDEALDVLRQAAAGNYIDFEAHRLLSKIYKDMELLDVAIREILIASVLNRNHPEIEKQRVELFREKGYNTDIWIFNPQVKITGSKKEVNIETEKYWYFYAACEALWQFDDDYLKTKQPEAKKYNFNRLQECILNHASDFMVGPDLAKSPEGKSFQKMLENRMFDEYVWYEAILPDYPEEALTLSDEMINKIATYVITVRGEVK